MREITTLSIRALRGALKRKDLSIREITRAFLDRIEETNPKLNSFITVEPEKTLGEAEELDRLYRQRRLKLGFLTGIPVAVKDTIITRGTRTTCGSRILAKYVPTYDATVISRLRKNGALVLGKTNCDEFAMGSSTEHSAFDPTRNPWDLSRVPGGSSGGSAAAVASVGAPAALGSDTGGSIRQPAAFCACVGLKPTYGRLSRYGLVAFASSLEQIGPVTSTVRDAAAMLQVLAGHDRLDSTSSTMLLDNYLGEIGKDVHELRIGVPGEWFGEGLDPRVRESTRAAIAILERLGCPIEEVHLPHSEYAIDAYYIIAPAEASSNLARFDGVRYGLRSNNHHDLESMYKLTRSQGFGEEVKRRIMIGTYVLSSGYYDAYYLKAVKVRTLIQQDYLKAFEKVDLVVGPVTPTPPFRLGEKIADPLQMYLSDVFTVPANLAGIPALSLPCGFTDEGLPIGLQVLGPHFHEARILRLAHALETELGIVKANRHRVTQLW